MKLKLFAALAVLLLWLAACGGAQGDEPAVEPDLDAPVSADDPDQTVPEDVDETDYVFGEANVDDVQVNIMESFPVQVSVTVSGFLTDGCTEIDETAVTRTDNTFDVHVTTKRPAAAVCTQELAPFEESVPLDVLDLPAGEYTIDVNGVTTTFTLDMDNSSPDEG